MKKIYKILLNKIAFLFVFLPLMVRAAADDWTIKDLINKVTGYAGSVFALLFGLLFVIFLWNGAQFMLGSHEPEEVSKVKNKLWVGVVALFVVVSLWGLVALVDNFVLK